jgi:hypothetical protein
MPLDMMQCQKSSSNARAKLSETGPRVFPEQSEMVAECSSAIPEQSEMMAECSCEIPEQSEMMAECSSVIPEQSEMVAECSSVIPEQSEMVAECSSVIPEQSEMMAECSSVVPEQSEMMAECSSVVPEQSEMVAECSRPSEGLSLVRLFRWAPAHHYLMQRLNLATQKKNFNQAFGTCGSVLFPSHSTSTPIPHFHIFPANTDRRTTLVYSKTSGNYSKRTLE